MRSTNMTPNISPSLVAHINGCRGVLAPSCSALGPSCVSSIVYSLSRVEPGRFFGLATKIAASSSIGSLAIQKMKSASHSVLRHRSLGPSRVAASTRWLHTTGGGERTGKHALSQLHGSSGLLHRGRAGAAGDAFVAGGSVSSTSSGGFSSTCTTGAPVVGSSVLSNSSPAWKEPVGTTRRPFSSTTQVTTADSTTPARNDVKVQARRSSTTSDAIYNNGTTSTSREPVDEAARGFRPSLHARIRAPAMQYSSFARPPHPRPFTTASMSRGGQQESADAANPTQRRAFSSSFMKRVMEQVQKDLEQSEEYQKAKRDFKEQGGEESAEKLRKKAAEQEERLRQMKDSLGKTADKTAGYFQSMKQSVAEQQEKIRQQAAELNEKADDNEFVKSTKDATGKAAGFVGEYASKAFGSAIDNISGILSKMDDRKAQTHAQWKSSQEAMRAYKEKQKQAEKEREEVDASSSGGKSAGSEGVDAAAQSAGEQAPGAQEGAARSTTSSTHAGEGQANALVVRAPSAWDRFGAKISDMPLLNSFYDNPLVDRMFGETEIAQSLREMKEILPAFRLAEFTEEIEQVVAPAIVRAYLEGDSEFLKMHCGEAAFMAVNASIKERRKLKLVLDMDVRQGPEEVELKGARGLEGGAYSAPTFVFTFHTQQINCLRKEGSGEVAEGAVDDIRSVSYAIAITRHPFCDEENEGDETLLEFPWLVSELAIVGNQPVW
ncbi:unnamed protein product [Amoebophrya sp. A25]|nr:unnamed protein product [Amoebophrya sp. A25]|eukprot:GSA25T00011172001.1